MGPTSARSGDGMGSLIGAIVEQSQTSLAKRISYTNELQATVMEVSHFLHTDCLRRNQFYKYRIVQKKVILVVKK